MHRDYIVNYCFSRSFARVKSKNSCDGRILVKVCWHKFSCIKSSLSLFILRQHQTWIMPEGLTNQGIMLNTLLKGVASKSWHFIFWLFYGSRAGIQYTFNTSNTATDTSLDPFVFLLFFSVKMFVLFKWIYFLLVHLYKGEGSKLASIESRLLLGITLRVGEGGLRWPQIKSQYLWTAPNVSV